MTPQQAARRLERFASDLPRAAEAAVIQLARLAYDRALWWSSGPLSTATLRKMGHPYARRRPDGLDPGRINVQSGHLVSSWVVAPARRSGDRVTATVFNQSREAAYMAGTALMVKRPLPERVVGELERRGAAEVALEAAIGRVMR